VAIDVLNISLYGYDEQGSLSIATFGYLTGEQIPEFIDFCAEAKARLAEQFKQSILLHGLICAFTGELQELDAVFQDLQINRAIDTAVGKQLEELAEIVGADITGLTTSEARAEIRFQIGINISNGEPETVIDFVKAATDASFIQYKEVYPAKVSIFTDGQTVPPGLNGLIQGVGPAGVGVEVVSSFGDPEPFAFAPEGGIPDPDGKGFGETTYPLEGGQISEKITT
jgi:hypothetical protein